MQKKYYLFYTLSCQSKCLKNNGFYVSPTIIEIDNLFEVKEEIFGPVIHIYKYKADKIEQLVSDINQMNYLDSLRKCIKILQNES